MKNLTSLAILLFASLSIIGCTEQYALQTTTFEEALVVEATLTNELKYQQIKISKTYRFEEDGPTSESGATVYVSDSDGNQYDFQDNFGSYLSAIPFEAVPGKSYTLHIVTSDGKSYTSTAETLTTVNPIQNVEATVQTVDGIRGVQINVESFDPTATSKYYRYEYEETYKIIAPRWSFFEAIRVPGIDHDNIQVQPRPPGETKTCYGGSVSNDILQTSTNDLSEDRVDHTIRFISDQNAIISHRYSILVRQYVQNLASYTFYKTLKELSGNGSILSQHQPGFFYGNMRSEDNPDEKVIGFFDVSSVSSQRIYFNYADLFPGENPPPYFTDCSIELFKFCFISTDPECRGGALLSAISTGTLLYYHDSGLYYSMVAPPCSDCTRLGSNIIPSFWEE